LRPLGSISTSILHHADGASLQRVRVRFFNMSLASCWM